MRLCAQSKFSGLLFPNAFATTPEDWESLRKRDPTGWRNKLDPWSRNAEKQLNWLVPKNGRLKRPTAINIPKGIMRFKNKPTELLTPQMPYSLGER